jgi:hypothetical protein
MRKFASLGVSATGLEGSDCIHQGAVSAYTRTPMSLSTATEAAASLPFVAHIK